ncbi:MAG: substrate-binding domain-containing protein [Verrucomicrobia bacterium]|nr:substrate-binding domain-containing protein [Verrucomicrobiota bacterium]
MSGLYISSGGEQVAAHLREGLLQGRWSGVLPGRKRLAAELGVSGKIVEAALGGIAMPEGTTKPRPLRVALMLHEANNTQLHYIVELQHLLIEAGHQVIFAPHTLSDLRMDVSRVARMVGKIETDAWVVVAGSQEVLRWFAAQPTPAMALFGRRRAVSIAGIGPEHLPALLAAVRKLLELGHRRIVTLVRPERRIPHPGRLERAILAEMAAKGIAVGPYNLPNWDGTREGLYRCLDSLYQLTPPTALLIDEAAIFTATQQHLARQGILAPQHVSLVCCDSDPAFDWFEPPITHIRWDSRPLVRRIVRWAHNVARGKNDRRASFTKAEFLEGGTIGPVKGG